MQGVQGSRSAGGQVRDDGQDKGEAREMEFGDSCNRETGALGLVVDVGGKDEGRLGTSLISDLSNKTGL